jgi:hypothetical protein
MSLQFEDLFLWQISPDNSTQRRIPRKGRDVIFLQQFEACLDFFYLLVTPGQQVSPRAF